MLAISTPSFEGIKMTAVITTTSKETETQLVDKNSGNTVETRYHDGLEAAMNYVESLDVDEIELEELDF